MREVIVRAVIASIALVLPAALPAAAAQKSTDELYPSKPIRLIVPFAPGGTNDILARMVAQHLNQTWGQAVIADNRAGAEGIIGTDLAVKARPDGYTLVVISSAYTMNPVVMKLPYEPRTALEFVAKMGSSFLVWSWGRRCRSIR
jgi:tripartite-type tricarboxylate transporter receptor subunit TctC